MTGARDGNVAFFGDARLVVEQVEYLVVVGLVPIAYVTTFQREGHEPAWARQGVPFAIIRDVAFVDALIVGVGDYEVRIGDRIVGENGVLVVVTGVVHRLVVDAPFLVWRIDVVDVGLCVLDLVIRPLHADDRLCLQLLHVHLLLLVLGLERSVHRK